MMKKTLGAFVLFTLSLSTYASDHLSTFQDIKTSLMKGDSVNLVVDLNQCTSTEDVTKHGTMVGGLKVNSFLIRPNNTISFSDTHFTVNSNQQPIMQFIRYTLNADNSVIFNMKTLELPSYNILGKEVSYKCTLNNGIKFLKIDH